MHDKYFRGFRRLKEATCIKWLEQNLVHNKYKNIFFLPFLIQLTFWLVTLNLTVTTMRTVLQTGVLPFNQTDIWKGVGSCLSHNNALQSPALEDSEG